MATNKRTLSRIGFYCGLALFLIITLFPFFVMLMTSFKSAKEAISLHPTLLPQQWTLEHYVDIFNPVIFPFVDYFRNSMVVSVVSSVVAVFLGILGAYALSRLRFKGRMTINASFYTVYMFSGILLVVPLFKIITALGIYDTEMALIITMVTQTLPTAVFMLKSYFDTIPDEIEEAAMMFSGIQKYFCYRFICLAIRRLPEVYCVIAGTTCQARRRKRAQRRRRDAGICRH